MAKPLSQSPRHARAAWFITNQTLSRLAKLVGREKSEDRGITSSEVVEKVLRAGLDVLERG